MKSTLGYHDICVYMVSRAPSIKSGSESEHSPTLRENKYNIYKWKDIYIYINEKIYI